MKSKLLKSWITVSEDSWTDATLLTPIQRYYIPIGMHIFQHWFKMKYQQ